MELEKFIKNALIAVQNGTQQAKAKESEAGKPLYTSSGNGPQGVEFDIGIEFEEEVVCVAGYSSSGEAATRIKFAVPIVDKR